MSQCKIYLDNYNGSYFSGAEIRGRLECYFVEQTVIRGIKIRLKCHEHNEWIDTEEYLDSTDNSYKTRDVSFTGDNDVLSMEQILFGSSSGSQDLAPGKQIYPFIFYLPKNSPSSYNGSNGYILYKLKGIVDRPMRTDYEDTFDFAVQSPIYINELPSDLNQLTRYSDDSTICCCCCRGGIITMNVELEKKVLIPGQATNLKVDIINLSNETVNGLTVDLVQEIQSKVDSPSTKTRENTETLFTLKEHGVGAHGEHTYNVKIELPDYTQVPNFAACTLFSVKYTLTIAGKLPKCHMDLEIEVNPQLAYSSIANQNQLNSNPNNQAGFVMPPVPPYQAVGAVYPPPIAGGGYPSPVGNTYPPPLTGNYPPVSTGLPGYSINEKGSYPGGLPSAPTPQGGPSAPPDMSPPPSYDETTKMPYSSPK